MTATSARFVARHWFADLRLLPLQFLHLHSKVCKTGRLKLQFAFPSALNSLRLSLNVARRHSAAAKHPLLARNLSLSLGTGQL